MNRKFLNGFNLLPDYLECNKCGLKYYAGKSDISNGPD